MSIVKIQSVRRLDKAVNYITRENKTEDHLISSFACHRYTILDDFESIDKERLKRSRHYKPKYKMIIQSFGEQDNVTPEQAHKAGKELADNYLKGDHQYIIATHLDGNHLHNHIIFNQVRKTDLKMFDSSGRNTVDNLRLENDNISRKYGLYIPNEKAHENKIHYINQRELYARKKGTSFKEELENSIDEAVDISRSYEEFLSIMENKGYNYKEGKYLAFENPKKKYFMRTKTLGMHYTENSLKYRIENKDFKIHKYKYTLQTEKIDKSQAKFRENYGLRKWATKKNIIHLQEISNLVFNQGMTLEEIEGIDKSEKEFMNDLENKLDKKDSKIKDLERMVGSFQDYKDSTGLMIALKNAEDKQEFKSKNFKEIMKHDIAKKNITKLKNTYAIESESELVSLLDELKSERRSLYTHVTTLQREQDKEHEKDQRQEKDKKQRRSL